MGTDTSSQTWIYQTTPKAQTLHRYRSAYTEQPQNPDTSVFKYKTHIFSRIFAGKQCIGYRHTDRVMSPHTKHSLYRGFTGLG